ncbi:DUF2917 domain-containing protein [Phreatobacter sp.]|uniref:DUF2917 domain-containing protein n=1 Tax=Phreatobacter sp. TaxID=1966341 RepID=UPI003F718211
MMCLSNDASLHLARGGLIRLTDAIGTTVACRSGAVWITIDSDRRDIVLEAGERFLIDRQGLALVCAIAGPAAVDVWPPGTGATAPAAAPVDASAETPVRRAA